MRRNNHLGSSKTAVAQTSGFRNTYMFTARRFDDKTGSYYFRNRYQMPCLGRFLSRDPLGYMDGLSLYVYVVNNSVNWLDPDGLDSNQETGILDWLRKLWGARDKPGSGLRTPQTRTPLASIGNTLISPEGVEAQRGGIEFVKRAQRDKRLAEEPVYGTYSPLSQSGNTPRQAPAPPKPIIPTRPKPTQDPKDLLSPRTKELMEATSQFYKVQDAFEAIGKQWDDLQCIPEFKQEYQAEKFRLRSQYFLLRRLKGEILKRINKLKQR